MTQSPENIMKKFLLISALIIAAALPVAAQKGLNVANVFDGRYAKLPGTVATYVAGNAVEKFNLSLYRSLALSADSATCSEIEHLVLKDGLTAISKETVYRGGRLRFGSFNLPRRNNNNRYIFYVNKDADWKNSRDAIQRGMQKLKGGYPADPVYKSSK